MQTPLQKFEALRLQARKNILGKPLEWDKIFARKPTPGIDDRRLKCAVQRLSYDFKSKTGELRLDDGDCTDMRGCIGIFEQIDPAVRTIRTWSGYHEDTSYHREAGRWIAIAAKA